MLLTVPYYSMVRFGATRAAGPPVALTIDTTKRVAFSYAQGQPMTSAGFLAGRKRDARRDEPDHAVADA